MTSNLSLRGWKLNLTFQHFQSYCCHLRFLFLFRLVYFLYTRWRCWWWVNFWIILFCWWGHRFRLIILSCWHSLELRNLKIIFSTEVKSTTTFSCCFYWFTLILTASMRVYCIYICSRSWLRHQASRTLLTFTHFW